ncbi:hypothetical protein RND81_09G250200 [Saponaria officinalis]|uniref:Uncharacterized protein n=1 Tax=Saponaria officinalis TaxID=3572 RepID=A0AAW1IQL9_SAPOF
MGLNDSFGVIRWAILMQNPLPSVSVVYNNLLQEERQREIQNAFNFQINSASFYAKNVNATQGHYQNYPTAYKTQNNVNATPFRHKGPAQNSDGELKCNYRNVIDKCRKLQYNNNKRRYANLAQTYVNDGLVDIFSNKDTTDEQALCSQFMQFLKQQQQRSVNNAVTSNANFAGLFNEDATDSW